MFYFSTVIGSTVYDKNDVKFGRIMDFAISTKERTECPSIMGVLVKAKKNKQYFILATQIATWGNGSITLGSDWPTAAKEVPLEKGILFLKKSVVDHQLIDLAGVKVVRVNDLRFGFVQGAMSLVAIDVSNCGLFRRLGFAKLVENSWFKPHFLEWKNVQVVGDQLQLGIGKDELVKLHPADLANLVEGLNLKQGSQLLGALDPKMAAKVMEEIKPEIQKVMVQHLGQDRAIQIMNKMSTDELVDLIQLLPDKESRKIIAEMTASKDALQVEKILEYDEDTAGGLMTTEFITARINDYVKEVIEKIRHISDSHRSIHFVYILDELGNFFGVVSLRRLLVAKKNTRVAEIAKKIKTSPVVLPERKIVEVAEILTKYNLLSVAVVDASGKMLGVVTVDDIMRHFMPNA